VLRVIGPFVGRVKRQEFPELVDRQHERFGGAFAEVGVADAQLRVRSIGARGVGFGDLLEKLPRREPFLAVERVGALVKQELVRIAGPRRNHAARTAGAGTGAENGGGEQKPEERRNASVSNQSIPVSHSYSAVRPSSRPTAGTNPKSAFASDVSAQV